MWFLKLSGNFIGDSFLFFEYRPLHGTFYINLLILHYLTVFNADFFLTNIADIKSISNRICFNKRRRNSCGYLYTLKVECIFLWKRTNNNPNIHPKNQKSYCKSDDLYIRRPFWHMTTHCNTQKLFVLQCFFIWPMFFLLKKDM